MIHTTKPSNKLLKKLLIFLPAAAIFMVTASVSAHDLKTGFTQFTKLSPELHSALGKAESLAEKKLFVEAKTHLESYKDSHPSETHPLFFYELGYFCHKSGDLDQAIAYLNKTIQSAPKFKDGWQLLAISWQEKAKRFSKDNKNRKQERYSAFQNSAQAMGHAATFSGDKDLLYQCALLWLDGEKPKKSLEILEKLCKDSSPKQEWFVALSDTLKALKRQEEAAEAMEKAARLQKNSEQLFHAAWLWADLEKPKRALPLLQMLTETKNPDKNWLLLLVTVYNTLQQPGNAARSLERVIKIDPSPDYLFNCGLLWLQDEKPDKALKSLLRLTAVQPLMPEWFVATAQAWLLKEDINQAADAMERAAILSKNPEHIYKAGVLRLQLKQADRSIALLLPLAEHSKPKAEWLVALANSWLLKENYLNGARYMEQAATISKKGTLYHQAAMLWRVENRLEKTISLLQKAVAVKKVEQLWLVDLASVLLDGNRNDEVRLVMARTDLANETVSSQLRYRGAVIWLNLQEPARAYPLLITLCHKKSPLYSWMASLVKTCVELERTTEAEDILEKTLTIYPNQVNSWKLAVWCALQQGNYINAAAAKEIVRIFESNEEKHEKDLSRLYLLAGVPSESARMFKNSLGPQPTIEETRHLIDIYLSGQMYKDALQPAIDLARKTNSAQHWESLGDIYYALRRFDDSSSAYEKASELNENPGSLMKAAYAAMKANWFDLAIKNFQLAIKISNGQEDLVASAMQNLTYIKKVQCYMKGLN